MGLQMVNGYYGSDTFSCLLTMFIFNLKDVSCHILQSLQSL